VVEQGSGSVVNKLNIFVTVFFSASYYVEEGYEKVAVFDQYLALSRK